VVKDGVFKARWFTSREIARLMGLPEDYKMPVNYNEAYYLVGDGLAVPVVSFIEKNLFRNILNEEPQRSEQPDEITAKQTTPRVYAPFSV
jgi:DNA (cytosine-5)-methyltransferase 1